jgi:hypothetical protein
LVMAVFGGLMLSFGLRKKPAAPPANDASRRAPH